MIVKYYVEVLKQREYEDKVDMITFLTFNNIVLKKAYRLGELLATKHEQIGI
jgi:hypothetical protein